MKVGYFVPPKVSKGSSSLPLIHEYFHPEPVHYAYKGRYAFHQILGAYKVKKVAIPGYICYSVVEVVHKSVEIVLYDIDETDLNPSADSLEQLLAQDDSIQAVLVPSLYGNPADLERFEQICLHYKVLMIDDAAQACGAQVCERNVGTFGEAGFISFSPGKPTAWYSGAFFYLSRRGIIESLNSPAGHYLAYINYRFNREMFYTRFAPILGNLTSILCRLFFKLRNPGNDRPAEWEKCYFNSVLQVLEDNITVRNQLRSLFIKTFKKSEGLRFIENIRGIASPCKIIVLFNSKKTRETVYEQLLDKKIQCGLGYKSLPVSQNDTPVAADIRLRILELPLEIDSKRFDYMLRSFHDIMIHCGLLHAD